MNISDIARMAGVSRASVSRYFNNGYISEEKKEAVRRVVEETGFRPSAQAKNLRMKKSSLVGVIVPRVDSYAIAKVVSGIMEVLEEAGYHIMLSVSQNDPQKEVEHLDLLRDKRVNGVILTATVFTGEHYRAIDALGLPLVIVGQKADRYDCVYHDDYHAIYDMTSRVLQEGRRRLVYLGVLREDLAVGEARYRGYCDAVRDAGYPELAERMGICDFVVEAANSSMSELIMRFPDLDGVICATDRLAVGAMRALKTRGIDIPSRVMITGCGDSELAQVTTPRLSTIHYQYQESGEEAARILLSRMKQEEGPPLSRQFGYTILEHDSTGTVDMEGNSARTTDTYTEKRQKT